jgi:hypothetical protein
VTHIDNDTEAPQEIRVDAVGTWSPASSTVSSARVRRVRIQECRRERTRFAEVLEDAAGVLERQGELPDAVRWLRKEAQAWRIR